MDAKSSEKRRLQIVPSASAGAAGEPVGDSKRLLPEVLPDPTARAAPGGPRMRALDRMTRLVAYAATSAALTAGCKDTSSGTSGYGVVDPMPPPSRCMGVAGGIKATAAWKQGDGGLVIEISLGKPAQPDASYDPNSKPEVSGATLGAVDLKDGAMTITIAPTSQGANYLWLNLAVACAAGPAHLTVSLTTGEAKAGAAVPVTVVDQY